MSNPYLVIPAEAGIHPSTREVQAQGLVTLDILAMRTAMDPGFRRDDIKIGGSR